MATVTKSIGSGKDYTSVTSWEAASYGATSSDDAVGEVYGTVTEGSEVIINDSTPISIHLTSVSSDRHTGTVSSGAKIQSTGNYTILSVSMVAKPVTIDWLIFDGTGKNVQNYGLSLFGGTSYTVKNNIIYNIAANRTTTVVGILLDTAGTTGYIYNNLIYNITNAGTGALIGIYVNNTSTTTIYCNTIDTITGNNGGTTIGIYFPTDDADFTIKDSLVTNVTSTGSAACYNAAAGWTNIVDAYNGADDASSNDGGDYDNMTIVYTSATDYTLDTGTDATALGHANHDLGSGDWDTDLKNRDRDASGDTWSLGAIQNVVAGGVTMPIFHHHYDKNIRN